MITMFTTAKPFAGHIGVIQRNALTSWTRLHPGIEVILFGDDPGAEAIARELGLRHEAHAERNEFGTKRLDYMFRRAQEIARNDVLCYVNCDVVLFPELCKAVEGVKARHEKYLMVGRRWDTNVTEPAEFSADGRKESLRALALREGVLQPGYSVDYFAFCRGLYQDMPALVIGRIWWDHWLVWKAKKTGAAVVDATKVVVAVHQNHDYGYHPAGAQGVWTDEQARSNFVLAGGKWHLFTIDDATHVLDENGEQRNYKGWFAPYWRVLRPYCEPPWHRILDWTRPVRKVLGLRKAV